MVDMDSLEYWGEKHDRLLDRFKALGESALRLRGEIRALNFKVSVLEQAAGADAAQVIGDLRVRVARREESVRSVLRHYHKSVGYKAPEVMQGFLLEVIAQFSDLLNAWEDEDASGSLPEVPGPAS